jgi:hypothetical protein
VRPFSTCSNRHALAVLLVAATAFSACAANRQAACHSGERAAIQEALYFGTAMPGGQVSAEDWQAFLAEVITPRFPDGLTAWAAAGQWRGQDGRLEKEGSFVLQLVHDDTPGTEKAVREVMSLYKERFHQEAVMRVREAACISF